MDSSLRDLLDEAVRDADLASADIPAIDLYLDQILSIFTAAVKNAAPRYADRLLTKTMINNYSKDGLILPVKGKKYSKEQILQMLLVYTLKNTLTMSEIKRVLSDVYSKQLPLTVCYDDYLAHKQDDRRWSVDTVSDMIDARGYDMTDNRDYFSALLEVCALSAYFRSMAQAMLEARYPDPDQVEQSRVAHEKEQERLRREAERQARELARASQKRTGKAEHPSAKRDTAGQAPSPENLPQKAKKPSHETETPPPPQKKKKHADPSAPDAVPDTPTAPEGGTSSS